MLSRTCLLAALLSGLALLQCGCTPAIQCDEAMADVQTWSSVSADSEDIVEVEVLPNVTTRPRWIRTNVTAPAGLRRRAPSNVTAPVAPRRPVLPNVTTPVAPRGASRLLLKPAAKRALLQKQRELLKQELLRVEKQLEQLGDVEK
jgi:hypothetical protein